MLFEEFIKKAKEKDLTFFEYCFLYFLFHKLPMDNIGEINLNKLLINGYIKPSEEGYIIRDKGIKLFSTEVEKFTEEDFNTLFEKYPQTTPSGRKLRPATADSMGFKTLYEAFKKKTKEDKRVYDLALLGLKREIATRKLKGDMNFMQMMGTWINNYSWEFYLDGDAPKEYTFEEML